MKTIKTFIFLILSLFLFENVYGANIESINVLDDKNIEFSFSKDVVLKEGNIESDIKFLKDIEIIFSSKDFDDQNKLILNLGKEIEKNKTYSLLTIIGPEANIDFTIQDSLENFEIINNKQSIGEKQGLNRLIIKDSKTLELYFDKIVEEEEFEFKLLNELKIKEIVSKENNIINLKMENSLEKLNSYLVMILSLKNNFGNEVVLEEDLYEVKTSADLKNEVVENNLQEKIKEEKEVVLKEENKEDEIVDVALNAAETPDTGPETTVLILLTFLLNTFLFIGKKIKK